jgi:hypothetical protein
VGGARAPRWGVAPSPAGTRVSIHQHKLDLPVLAVQVVLDVALDLRHVERAF